MSPEEIPADSPFSKPDAASPSARAAPGPGQYSLRTLALITFDCAFILSWWRNLFSATPLAESMVVFTAFVLLAPLRVGFLAFPFYTAIFAFWPAFVGASLGSCAMRDVQRRREVRGASLFWTLLSAMFVELCVRIVFTSQTTGPYKYLLFLVVEEPGWEWISLVVYGFCVAMISAGYGGVIALFLSLLGRWRIIPLAAPWKDAPWRAMRRVGLFGPPCWLAAYFLWALLRPLFLSR
jgi:hypothetical protein